MATPPSKKKRIEEKKKPLVSPALAFSLPAILGYLIARRPFNSGNAARAIRSKGLLMQAFDTPGKKLPGPLRDLYNYLQYGTKNIDVMGATGRAGKLRTPHVSFLPDVGDRGQYIAPLKIGPNRLPKTNLATNKLVEAKMIHAADPKLMADTASLKEMPRNIKQIRSTPQRLRAIKAWLKERFPRGYIIKPVDGSQAAGHMPTTKDDLAKIWTEYNRRQNFTYKVPGKRSLLDRVLGRKVPSTSQKISLRDIQRMERADPNKSVAVIDRLPGLQKGLFVKQLAKHPSAFMVQEKHRLLPTSSAENKLNKILGNPAEANKEFRIHALGTKVIPGASRYRHSLMRNLPVLLGMNPAGTVEAEKAVAALLKKLPKEQTKNMPFAFDVAPTRSGMKIIEANPTGYSGFLHPSDKNVVTRYFDPFAALASHNLVSQLQGQRTALLSAARGLGYGAAGLGAATVANKLTDS